MAILSREILGDDVDLVKVDSLARNCHYSRPKVKYKFDLELALVANREACEQIFGKLSDIDFQIIFSLRDILSPPKNYEDWRRGLLTWNEVRERVEEVRELLEKLDF